MTKYQQDFKQREQYQITDRLRNFKNHIVQKSTKMRPGMYMPRYDTAYNVTFLDHDLIFKGTIQQHEFQSNSSI